MELSTKTLSLKFTSTLSKNNYKKSLLIQQLKKPQIKLKEEQNQGLKTQGKP
jgi:hypothetical protein